MSRNSKTKRIVWIIFFILFSALVGYLTARTWHTSRSIFVSGRNPVAQLASLFDGKALAGENRDQVNVLLLGIGGDGHEGPYLADTIIVASIKPKAGEIAMLSLPRDLQVEIPPYNGKYKINHLYTLGNTNNDPKKGLTQARQVVSEATGLDIPYAVVVDFRGFVKAVDELGGIDVRIEKTFTDHYYPNSRNGYLPPVTFKAGIEHMDGERALIYARSRYSTSDFDRARRQQQILEAFSARVKELNLLSNLKTFNNLFNDFSSNVATNMEPGEVKRLADIGLNVNSDKIYSSVLDPTTGIVCSFLSKQYGYHLTLCRGKTEKDLHNFAATTFARAHVANEAPNVELQNATGKPGLSQAAGESLIPIGFKTTAANAASLTNNSRTVVYDLTNGQKPDSLATLLVMLGGTLGKNPPIAKTTPQPDFIVILGNDYIPPHLDVINLDPPEPEEQDSDTSTSTPTTTPDTLPADEDTLDTLPPEEDDMGGEDTSTSTPTTTAPTI